MICFEYVCSVHIPTSSNRRYLYERGNYQQFNYELMNLDWDGLFSGLSGGIAFIQYTVNYWTNTFQALFVPLLGILHNG